MAHNNDYASDELSLAEAHQHTSHNRRETDHSDFCCCICCETRFHSSEIIEYTDSGDTAICPYCSCDAVIGDGCGIKMTDELLMKLNEKIFLILPERKELSNRVTDIVECGDNDRSVEVWHSDIARTTDTQLYLNTEFAKPMTLWQRESY